MVKSILGFLAVGAVLSAAPVNVSFVNPGSPGVVVGNDYVGPYTLSVNGVDMPAMCMDDFLTVGGGWQANETAVTSSNLGNTYLGSGSKSVLGTNYSSSQIYTAEAYLFSEIIKPGADRGDIQEAAWAIMDPASMNNVINSNNTGVINVLEDVANNYSSFNVSGYSIISQAGAQNEQEFIVASAPEPATFALLGAALVAAGAARKFRQRSRRKA